MPPIPVHLQHSHSFDVTAFFSNGYPAFVNHSVGYFYRENAEIMLVQCGILIEFGFIVCQFFVGNFMFSIVIYVLCNNASSLLKFRSPVVNMHIYTTCINIK
jgi:hypothetical protein